MQVFEFRFSPKKQSDSVFDSFCYTPKTAYEKRVGNLYMVGALRNVLPQNERLLEKTARVIKEKYYRPSSNNPEKSLKESLKEANIFLQGVGKKGDVSWLGNLSFATLSLKNYELNFTKVNDIKIILLRQGQIIDIDRKLKFTDVSPWPLKVFGNIISGKLAENDVIMVLNEEVLEKFKSENLLNIISKIRPFSWKNLKSVLDKKNEKLLNVSGICLMIFLTKEILSGKKETISPKIPKKEFSFKEVFGPIVELFKKIIKKPKFLTPVKKTRTKPAKFSNIKGQKPKLKLNRNLILIFIFLLFLIGGFSVFESQQKKQMEIYKSDLGKIEDNILKAENYLALIETRPQAARNANFLLKESWDKLSPYLEISATLPKTISDQVISIFDKISKDFAKLNNVIEIPDPQQIFEFSAKPDGETQGFIAQKIILSNNNLYFYSPYSSSLFELNLSSNDKKIYSVPIAKGSGVSAADLMDSSIVLFSKSENLVTFRDGEFGNIIALKNPFSEFNFSNFSSYKGNFYFLDKTTGEIIKYPYLGGLKWGSPETWLAANAKKPVDGQSMAVDGSVWVINKDQSISQYYSKYLQKTLNIDVFPEPTDLSKIITSNNLPYLYLMEPAQKRIIITDKSGLIIKQFQSDKFDNLLDFTVSGNGKEIYLLNGLKVYKITD
ncbi:MAG: hypothetical protein WC514_03145 [Candidatus Paceibacterota bacterium]